MAFNFAYSADRPPLSGIADEDGILPGELVFADASGVGKATYADGRISGVVEDFADAHSADHRQDYRSGIDQFTYDTGMRVKFAGDEHNARLRVRTIDDNGTDPAANISAWDVVGIPDKASLAGRLVQEGYTDNAGTVYDRAGGNFLPVGRARGTASSIPSNSFDDFIDIVRRVDW